MLWDGMPNSQMYHQVLSMCYSYYLVITLFIYLFFWYLIIYFLKYINAGGLWKCLLTGTAPQRASLFPPSLCLTCAEPRAAARASADTGQRASSLEPAQSPAETAEPARSRVLSDYTPPTSDRVKERMRNMLINCQIKVFTCDHPKRVTLAEVFGTHSVDVAKCVVAGKQISSLVQGGMSQDGGICWEMSSV